MQASRWWREHVAEIAVTDEVGLPGTGAVLFASAAFDIRTGASVFVIPRVVLGRSGTRTWLTAPDDEQPELDIDEVAAPGAVRYADGAQGQRPGFRRSPKRWIGSGPGIWARWSWPGT